MRKVDYVFVASADNALKDNIELVSPAILAEMAIRGNSPRVAEFLGRDEQSERLAPRVIPEGYILCKSCGKYRTKSEFSPDTRKRNGAHSFCKECRAKGMKFIRQSKRKKK